MHLPPDVLSTLKSFPQYLPAASPENDIYALGCVAHQILYRELLCDNLGAVQAFESNIGKIDLIVWGASSANSMLLNLFKMCCMDDSKDRPSIQEVKQTVDIVARKTWGLSSRSIKSS